MSAYLWKYYLQDDLDAFRQFLAAANSGDRSSKSRGSASAATAGSSPGRPLAATSPSSVDKSRSPLLSSSIKKTRSHGAVVQLAKQDINAKDAGGCTLMHHVASSTAANAYEYARALLELPTLDLYVQDLESGWTALHRALYVGNVAIAHMLMRRDIEDMSSLNSKHHAGGLIKIKDKEGNSPFDLYRMTVCPRKLQNSEQQLTVSASAYKGASSPDDSDDEDSHSQRSRNSLTGLGGDELYTFGSNKNMNLGLGNEDDRQFPERILLRRPEKLTCRLFAKQQQPEEPSVSSALPEIASLGTSNQENVPVIFRCQAPKILDVQISKFHTAVLTTDPEANLYVCGFGTGGRLGTGDTATRFTFVPVLGGGLGRRKAIAIGLGQNHSLAVCDGGEVYSWGSNAYGQLGYATSQTIGNEDPVQLQPGKIFGPLRREAVIGCAASRTHSVVFTASSLYTFGKNDGQLGLVDLDATQLPVQPTPRKVAASLFSSNIAAASAIDRATICLLQSHEVWVFTNFGYSRLVVPLQATSHALLQNRFSTFSRTAQLNYVTKICSGGDTICGLTKEGDVFSTTLKAEKPLSSSSTNEKPNHRAALPPPQRIWAVRKNDMAVRDVAVGEDGSIIISTEAGSVWRRVKRIDVKNKDLSKGPRKDFKFSRVPSLTGVVAVRSNAFGAFAAVRYDRPSLKSTIEVAPRKLWTDLFPLTPLNILLQNKTQYQQSPSRAQDFSPSAIKQAITAASDIDKELSRIFEDRRMFQQNGYDITIGSTASHVRVPCHEFVLAARSPSLRTGISRFRQEYFFALSDVLTVEYDNNGLPLVLFRDVDVLTLVNIIFFAYTDGIVDIWDLVKQRPKHAARFRQVRQELTKIAALLEMRALERAVSANTEPTKSLDRDLQAAITDPSFFETGDIEIELDDSITRVHSALVCKRCPFFEGLFHGRARGGWLASRVEQLNESVERVTVDLSHVDSDTFQYVIRYMYADEAENLFDDTVVDDLETLVDILLSVMSVANELLLGRLAQACQQVLGRFVNIWNVSSLLNAVAPCSETGFKNAALEYICLNLEGLLENGLLDDLDEDLMKELDTAVRHNQLARMPCVRSGAIEAEIFERYPELPEMMEEARSAKINSMILKSRAAGDETKSPKTHKGSPSASKESIQKMRAPSTELLFEMDDDVTSISTMGKSKPRPKTPIEHATLPILVRPQTSLKTMDTTKDMHSLSETPSNMWGVSHPDEDQNSKAPQYEGRAEELPSEVVARGSITASSPWKSSPFSVQKLNMKDIMDQASESRQSNISAAMQRNAAEMKSPKVKVSQRERKKMFQEQKESTTRQKVPSPPVEVNSEPSRPQQQRSPWQTPQTGSKISLKDVLAGQSDASVHSVKSKSASSTGLTLRQTLRGNAIPSSDAPEEELHRAGSAGKNRNLQHTMTEPRVESAKPGSSKGSGHYAGQKSVANAARSEPSLQLSMAEILAQQQTEKEIVKEATAKRSLQEIQEEQAFQEWWDQEEAATRAKMDAERKAAEAAAAAKGKIRRGKSRNRGRGAGKAAGDRGTSAGASSRDATQARSRES